MSDKWVVRTIWGIVAMATILGVVFVVDCATREEVGRTPVKVISRGYVPTQTGVGNGVSTGGNATTVITNTPESHTVIVERPDGRAAAFEVRKSVWEVCSEGKTVDLVEKKGVLGISSEHIEPSSLAK
jgi:hypothetical protein